MCTAVVGALPSTADELRPGCIGLILGGIASWIGQGKWRSMAKERTREAYRWKTEADRLMRERDVADRSVGLPSPSRSG